MIFLPPFLIFAIVFLSFSRTVQTSSDLNQEPLDLNTRSSSALLEYVVLQELKKEAEQQAQLRKQSHSARSRSTLIL